MTPALDFADVAGPCPACRHGLEFADLTIVANCAACGSTWWRDHESAPWEQFLHAFGRPPTTKATKRKRQTLADYQKVGGTSNASD